MKRARELGPHQIECLKLLRKHGTFPGGWVYDTPSGTVKILESLAHRGLAETYRVSDGRGGTYTAYRVTAKAKVFLRELHALLMSV